MPAINTIRSHIDLNRLPLEKLLQIDLDNEALIQTHRDQLDQILSLLVTVLNDARICNPDIKEQLLATTASVLDSQTLLRTLEQCSMARAKLVSNVVVAFDSRLWHPVSGILLKLVQGGGFGQAAEGQAKGSKVGLSTLCQQRFFTVYLHVVDNILIMPLHCVLSVFPAIRFSRSCCVRSCCLAVPVSRPSSTGCSMHWGGLSQSLLSQVSQTLHEAECMSTIKQSAPVIII